MTETSQGVYHCPSCGALAPVKGEAERICAECGFHFGRPVRIAPRSPDPLASSRGSFVQRDVGNRRRVAGKVEPVQPADPVPLPESPSAPPARGEEGPAEMAFDDGNRKVIRRRKSRKKSGMGPLILLGGWAILVMLVVIAILQFGGGRDRGGLGEREDLERRERARERELREYASGELPECKRTLKRFLLASSWEKRSQLVRDSTRLAPAIQEYYRSHRRWVLPKGATLEPKSVNLYLHEGKRPVMQTVFGISVPPPSGDEAAPEPIPDREVFFVREDGRWVIDWEALVSHSRTSWSDFVNGTEGGEESGEFRVYARLAGAHLDNPTKLAVKFRSPPDHLGAEPRVETESIEIMLDTESGQRLKEIFDRKADAWEPGDLMPWKGDADGLRRVRVELCWKSFADDSRGIRLQKVVAGNWLGKGLEDYKDGNADRPEAIEVGITGSGR